MKEENNTEGLYTLKIDARHYFPDGKITWDVLEALRCRKYAEVLAFYLECDLDDIEKTSSQTRGKHRAELLRSTPQDRRRYAAEQGGKTGPTLPLAYQTGTGSTEPRSQTSS